MREGKREGEEKYYQLEIANENVVEKTAHKEVHAQITINDKRYTRYKLHNSNVQQQKKQSQSQSKQQQRRAHNKLMTSTSTSTAAQWRSN